MAPAAKSHILLTGPPGCGKTTVLSEVVRILRESSWEVYGFWTPEIREGGTRLGFAVELMSGEREVLASRRLPGPPRVGRYGVNVAAIDRLVVPEVERGAAAAQTRRDVIVVMDEIGKMELLSRSFQEAVLRAFDSQARILGTIMARPHPFADMLKARPDVAIVHVAPGNRESLPASITRRLFGR